MKKIKFRPIIIFFFVLLLYYLPSFFFTIDKEYYNSLIGPKLPPYVYIIAWSIIYITMAIFVTYYYLKIRNKEVPDAKRLLVFVAINYVLQALFIPFFFYLKDLFLSYVDCLFVFVSILLITLESLVINKKITLLTLPYLIWSVVASILSILFYLQN